MKSLADDGGVVPRRAKTRRFQLVWTPYTGQIRGRDVARTTFHTVSLETVWKIARWLLDCGHGWSTVSKIALFGILLSPCRAPVGGLFEFPDSLSRDCLETRRDDVWERPNFVWRPRK